MEFCLRISFFLFVDNLSFIESRYSIKKLAKIFEQVAIIVLNCEKSNTITYDLAKIEAILFFQFHWQ